jgi:hypothetical protein
MEAPHRAGRANIHAQPGLFPSSRGVCPNLCPMERHGPCRLGRSRVSPGGRPCRMAMLPLPPPQAQGRRGSAALRASRHRLTHEDVGTRGRDGSEPVSVHSIPSDPARSSRQRSSSRGSPLWPEKAGTILPLLIKPRPGRRHGPATAMRQGAPPGTRSASHEPPNSRAGRTGHRRGWQSRLAQGWVEEGRSPDAFRILSLPSFAPEESRAEK